MKKKENDTPEMQKKWSKVCAKAWADPQFKKKLMRNPREVLKEFGIELPPNITYTFHEDTSTSHHIVLPEPPRELAEEDLEKVAGAGSCCCPFSTGGVNCCSPFCCAG
ncbi:MAG: NHLP leader peptide family RiPP precursor [Chlamydiales bacterium]